MILVNGSGGRPRVLCGMRRFARGPDAFGAFEYSEGGDIERAVRLSWAPRSGRGDGIACKVVSRIAKTIIAFMRRSSIFENVLNI